MINITKIFISFLLVFTTITFYAQEIKPAEVKQIMKKVADWQIEHFTDYNDCKKPHHPLDWTNGALYVGMVKWAEIADNNKYYNWLKEIGKNHEWKLYRRKYHADDHTVGRQMYIELYRKYKDEKMIEPTKEQFEFIMYHPSKSVFNWKTPYHQDRWNWCNALFMSPPVWAKLYNITGERKYIDFMLDEYKASTNFLFDKKEHLYYRDERYMTQTDNGTKVLWSPGCGSLTEIARAEELGCEIVKLFPEDIYGPQFVKGIKGPQPWTSIMPTGGVSPTEDNLKSWFDAGVTCVGMGSQLISKDIIANKDFDTLKNKMKEALEIIKQVRK